MYRVTSGKTFYAHLDRSTYRITIDHKVDINTWQSDLCLLLEISAILSDYDGTLCPTSNTKDFKSNKIPVELDNTLSEISKDIPVWVVSSKDYDFLCDKTRFARIVSCIMGIETIVLESRGGNDDAHLKNGSKAHLITDITSLSGNSKLLTSLGKEIAQTFSDVSINYKYTSKERILAGITIDYRHLEDWDSYKTKVEPLLYKRIQQTKSQRSTSISELYVETYSTHPLLDIYGIRCDKGNAFDSVLRLLDIDRSKNIMYLGDSENDNAAFAKADVSIGVHSDERIRARLNCQYNLDFDRLSLFLRRLSHNNFEFSDKLVD
jgi:HAD superfamily hydrolase (TIGR01484 family)